MSSTGPATRQKWLTWLDQLSRPVLTALAEGRFRRDFPVEVAPDGKPADRAGCTHLEAVGRLFAGISAWLAHTPATTNAAETKLHTDLSTLAATGLTACFKPSSPDALNFTTGGQPIVDAAFLAHAMLRAPQWFRSVINAETLDRILNSLALTRTRKPVFNNWLLFSSTIEAALCVFDRPWDRMRVDYAFRQHMQWYLGDGLYADGPSHHFDYYNSFVIHPMLLATIEAVGKDDEGAWASQLPKLLARAQRYATVLERSIAPDGTFPPIGRSLTYRAGAFQLLADLCLQEQLPVELHPAQARTALTAVLSRTLDAPGTFDDQGFLRLGLSGHQPHLAERYISTGSLYLVATALLPLGLSAESAYWTGPARPTTWARAWAGEPLPPDHAIAD